MIQAVNPATGEWLDDVEEVRVEEVPRVYERAREAFASWKHATIDERVALLRRTRLYIVHHLEALAEKIAANTGKVAHEALMSDLLPVLETLRHTDKHLRDAVSPKKVGTPILFPGKQSYIEYQPVGVVLVIAPWNFPFQLTVTPVLHALAAGNVVVLKPSEVTPLVGVLIEEVFAQSGWPAGVVQVAHGGRELGAALVEARPDYVFFTGSVRTGRIIQEAAAKLMIPTTLEMGGKDPMVVFADAHLDRAVNAAVWGGLFNTGQVCMSVERIYVERSIFDAFVPKLMERVGEIRQGTEPEDDIGSMTYPAQVDLVRQHVEEALAGGAQLVYGRLPEHWGSTDAVELTEPRSSSDPKQMSISPMVLTDVREDMQVMAAETFGPVLPVVPFDTEEDAVRLANGTAYALSASVFTADRERGRRVARDIASGNVLVNDVVITIVNPNLPFGGDKSSGLGRYHGPNAIQMFCSAKAVMVDSGKKAREVNWFPYAGKYPLMVSMVRAYYGARTNWGKFLRAYLRLLRIGR